jgi:Na+/H+ antiporter NhaD/arsenite permease-like protein
MIGSAAGLSFNDFLVNLAPIAFIILGLYLALVCIIFRKSLAAPDRLRELALRTDESSVITDPGLLRKSLIVMALTIVGFLLSRPLGLEAATVALGGAGLLLLWSGESPEEALVDVEWSLLIFFVGLFILVEGLLKVGIIDQMANALLAATGDNVGIASMAILWMSAVLSGIIDNTPYTAAMLPFVKAMGEQVALEPLWWSLALGACLGGNLTVIAASANVYVVDVAKKSGHVISFKEFLMYGVPVTIGSMVVCSIYVWLRYLM